MGSSIIIALPRIEDAKKIGDILGKRGYTVTAVCTSAAAVLAKASELDCGAVICGKQLTDMYYVQLAELLPNFFEMLLLTKTPEMEELPDRVYPVRTPVKVGELLNTLEAMLTLINRRYRKNKGPRQRSAVEQKAIDDAKAFLISEKGMTEQEAFRYIQKTSMDSGTNMVECAQMIIMLGRS